MEDAILRELKQIRKLLSLIVGTSDLPPQQQFSKDAVAKAAREYRKLSIQRGEWVEKYNIDRVIKHAPYNNTDKILIDKFGFTAYFRFGKTLYFNKKVLQELNKELKNKNINLETYNNLLNEQEKFEKNISKIISSKGKKPSKYYKIPEELRDIFFTPFSEKTEQLVRAEIANLLTEYDKFGLSEYINLYEGKAFAMFKYEYSFERYLEPDIRKLCKDWCFKYNYAYYALRKILEVNNNEEGDQ